MRQLKEAEQKARSIKKVKCSFSSEKAFCQGDGFSFGKAQRFDGYPDKQPQ